LRVVARSAVSVAMSILSFAYLTILLIN